MNRTLYLSVHQLVDFLLRSGDIDNRIFNTNTMLEGSKIHSFYQKEQSALYLKEYPLKTTIYKDGLSITLEGRADGIIKYSKDKYVIDELKTTISDLETFFTQNEEWHLGQAKCYAYMFMKENSLETIGIQLTYIRQGKEKDKLYKKYSFHYIEIENYVLGLIDEYCEFYNVLYLKNKEKLASVETLSFPFSSYRKGQRDVVKYAYSLASKGGTFFLQSPTGSGKTMSTMFPFIKAIQNDPDIKLFYLTAKSSGKENAFKTTNILIENGLKASQIMIKAKDKICFCKGKACNPIDCKYARGYYNKIKTVLTYCIINYSSFNTQLITDIARENEICPFEFELDLSLFVDIIICDYNYMFNPTSHMKRYFDEDTSHFLTLIDEAHNLVDRSKDMYSASISYLKLKKARKEVRLVKNNKLKLALSKMNKVLSDIYDSIIEGETILESFPLELIKRFNLFTDKILEISKDESDILKGDLLDFYLDVNQFLKIKELQNSDFIRYYEKEGEELVINLFCLDASSFLYETLSKNKANILFSATLSPIKYYMDVLGGDKQKDFNLTLPSVFDPKNLKILVAPNVSIRYKNRSSSYIDVINYLKAFISSKVGNYLVYLPSYEYLENLTSLFDLENVVTHVQTKDMSEESKEEFLTSFMPEPKETHVGFVVLGGVFGEGIDLVNDRLIGVAIIGIGLPRINFKSNKIKEHYDSKGLSGYNYAYLNPGMNKVMQAIGRVIRSETDKGAVLLIDERYTNRDYKQVLRTSYQDFCLVFNEKDIKRELTKFFND